MIGLLLKVAVVCALLGGGYYYLESHNSSLLKPQELTSQLKDVAGKVSFQTVSKNLSSTLDSLITNADSNSPVVLGVKISNESLSTVVNFLQNLPPEQINEIKSIICTPATPSAN